MNVPLNAREGANEGGPSTLAPPESHTSPGDVNTRRRVGPIDAATLPRSDTRPLDAARTYIAHGLAVVPCCAPVEGGGCTAKSLDAHKHEHRAGKIPTAKWQGRGATGLDEAARWWGRANPYGPNIALLMGPGGVLAVDVDGPKGEASLAAAEAVLGALPSTLENITGRVDGGRHLVFRVPADATDDEVKTLTKSDAAMRLDVEARRFVACASTDEGSGLDLRAGDVDAGRSYIIVAPSLHASGARYQWRGGPIAELPAAWWAALPRKGARPGLASARTSSPAARSGQGQLAGLDAPSMDAHAAGELAALNALREGEGLAPLARLCGCRVCSSCHALQSLRAGDIDGARMMVAPELPDPDDEHAAGERIASAIPSTSRPSPPPGQRSVSLAMRAVSALREALPKLCAEVRDAPDGAQNATLNANALRAFRLTLAAGSSLDETAEALIAAGREGNHPEARTRATVASARTAAEAQGPAELRERERPQKAPKPRTRKPPRTSEGEAADAGEADDVEGVEGPGGNPSGRPSVLMGTDQDRIVTECIAALAAAPELYQRHPFGLQRIIAAPPGGVEDEGSPVPRDVPAVYLSTMILARCITFESFDKKGELRTIAPPGWIAPAVLSVQSYPREIIRPLRGIIEAPALRPDGSVLTAPGYDPTTELLLHWNGAPVDVPERPTHDDARAAFEELAAVFEDATFAGERRTGLAACVAAILTPLARSAVRGPVPAFMWEANGAGAGKTTLAQICGAVVMGRAPAVRTLTANDEENSKHLAGIAKAAPPVSLFDNAKVGVEGGSLEAAITAHDRIAPRTLGTNDTPELPWRTTIYVTANDASYSPDTHQRFVHVSLLAPTGPRTYRHASPILHAIEHRPALLRASLTILRAHVVADRPRASVGHERFVEWSRVVADAVAWSSGADPARARPPESASRETEAARAVVIAWWQAIGSEEVSLAALRRRLDGVDPAKPGAATPKKAEALVDLRAALAEMCGVADFARASPVALGKRLGRVVGRRYPLGGEGVAVALTARDDRNGVKLWCLDGRPIGEGRPAAGQGEGVRGMRGVAGDSPACSQNDSDEWGDIGGGASGAIGGRVEGADPPHPPAPPAPDNGRVMFDA